MDEDFIIRARVQAICFSALFLAKFDLGTKLSEVELVTLLLNFGRNGQNCLYQNRLHSA
jgi:hypothetical protein